MLIKALLDRDITPDHIFDWNEGCIEETEESIIINSKTPDDPNELTFVQN